MKSLLILAFTVYRIASCVVFIGGSGYAVYFKDASSALFLVAIPLWIVDQFFNNPRGWSLLWREQPALRRAQ